MLAALADLPLQGGRDGVIEMLAQLEPTLPQVVMIRAASVPPQYRFRRYWLVHLRFVGRSVVLKGDRGPKQTLHLSM